MSNYIAKKFPMAQNIALAMDARVGAAMQKAGWNLPCKVVAVSSDGLSVTVSIQVTNANIQFSNVTVPISESRYIRIPVQIGDFGYLVSTDITLSSVTGKQNSVPVWGQSGNYEQNMAFVPVSNIKTFPLTPNVNAVLIQGPQGVIITDDTNGSTITLTASGINMVSGSASVQITHDGNVNITGTLNINGKPYMAHEHGGVSTGTAYSAGVHNP